MLELLQNHDWINLTDMDVSGYFIDENFEWERYELEKYVLMTNTGEWKWINENEAGIVA